MKLNSKPARFFAILIGLLLTGSISLAQDHVDVNDVEVGDQVEVNFLGKWISAEVIEIINNHLIKTKFEHPNSGKETTFMFSERSVRFADGKAENTKPMIKEFPKEARTWTSSNGKFTIDATISGIEDGQIRLERSDGKIVVVPIEKLGKEDQDYIETLLTAENPFGNVIGDAKQPTGKPKPNKPKENAIAGMPLTEPDTASSQPIKLLNIKPWSFQAFTFPPAKDMTQLGEVTSLPKMPKIDTFRFVSKEQKALMFMNGFMNDPGHLVVLNSDTGEQIANFQIPVGNVKVTDFSPDGSLAVSVSTEHNQSRIDIWEPTETELKHLKGWELPNGGGSFSQITEAVFVGNDKLATADRKKNLYIWDVPNAKLMYEKEVAPFGPSGLRTTPDGNQLIFMGDQKINVLDVATGKITGSSGFKMGNGQVAVSQDGKLAACVGNSVSIWNAKGSLMDEFVLPSSFHPGQCEWYDEQFLLVNGTSRVSVVDTQNRVILARYDLSGCSSHVDHRGLLWLLKPRGAQAQFGTIQIDPTKYVEKLPAQGDDLLLFRPGQTARLDIDLPFERNEIEKIRSHFERELAKRDIKLANSGDITIQLSTKRGKTREMQTREIGFRGFGRGGFGGFPNTTTVRVTPTTMNVNFIKNGKNVWTQAMTSDVMGMIHMEEDESVQQAVDRITKPRPEFFLGTSVPEKLAEHPPSGAFAIIRLCLNGIESEVFPSTADSDRSDF